MKSILFCLTALVLITISACHTKDANLATINFSEATLTQTDFIFSTCQGKTLIMADASAAQKMSNLLKQKTGAILSDMGVGNAFALNMNGKPFLCTAVHATEGLEKYRKNIGADITIIDCNAMAQENSKSFELTTAYDMDTVIRKSDSVFIRGYLFNTEGELQSVTVSGKGEILDKDYYIDKVVNSNKQYLQERALVMRLDENVDLSGLSGSPAFNKQGKVIGVYSGRTMEQENGKDTYYIRVSLFN